MEAFRDDFSRGEVKSPEPMAPVLLPLEALEERLWPSAEEYDVTWDPKINTTGDRTLPWPVGKVKRRAADGHHLVYDTRGPACTAKPAGGVPQGPGAMLIADPRGGGLGVRALDPLEVPPEHHF